MNLEEEKRLLRETIWGEMTRKDSDFPAAMPRQNPELLGFLKSRIDVQNARQKSLMWIKRHCQKSKQNLTVQAAEPLIHLMLNSASTADRNARAKQMTCSTGS